jgi:hypothetical protein
MVRVGTRKEEGLGNASPLCDVDALGGVLLHRPRARGDLGQPREGSGGAQAGT